MSKFVGFPREFVSFFDRLKKNNSKDKMLGPELKKAVKKVADQGYVVNGQHYKKVPRGYEADHPNAHFLLYNGLTARLEEKVPDAFFSDAIIDYAYSHYRNMLPLHRWLKKVLDG
jgi:hypothetical protein